MNREPGGILAEFQDGIMIASHYLQGCKGGILGSNLRETGSRGTDRRDEDTNYRRFRFA